MKIVSVSQTQTFTYIPRVFATETLIYTVTDEQTNKSQSSAVFTSVDSNKNYLTATINFGSGDAPFREAHFYTLEVKKTDDTLIYRDKIFCTDQTPVTQSRYNVNENVYETNDTHDNDYIVL
jgi:hypothetical protein